MCSKTITKPEAVLFDLDGTVLDTAKDLGEALNHVLESLNMAPKSYDEYRPVASHGALGLLKLGLAEKFNDFEIEPLRLKLLDYYMDNISRHTCLFEGMDDCISQLDSLNIPWAIVTNKPAFLTDKLVTYHPQLASSKINVSGDTLPLRKPNPEPLWHACEYMQVNSELCWYVGDAQRDIEAGNRAGMRSIVANWGYTQDKTPVEQWQADHIVQSANDLKQMILRGVYPAD